MTCPACDRPLPGLGTFCPRCDRYTADMDPPERLRLTLPLPPNMGNARMHHMAKHRKQKEWRELADAWTAADRLPAYEDPVRLSARLYVWNTMDEDNLSARLKWVQDWLVQRKVIVDDHPDCLTLGDVSQEIDRKRTRVEIVLDVKRGRAA